MRYTDIKIINRVSLDESAATQCIVTIKYIRGSSQYFICTCFASMGGGILNFRTGLEPSKCCLC